MALVASFHVRVTHHDRVLTDVLLYAPCDLHLFFFHDQVANEEAMPQELVHHGQLLRLSFRDPLPMEVRVCLQVLRGRSGGR